MSLTAGAPTPVLVASLERAGWGALSGADLRGLRVVLGALARLLPRASGQGLSTAEQVAAASGYSVRWTRRCLYGLEEAGLVTWQRGGIAAGKPQPSRFRIDKRAVLALVHVARELREETTQGLAVATRARIAGLRALYMRSRRHKPRSVHAELSASPPPTGEDPGPRPAPPGPPVDTKAHARAARVLLREARYA